MLSVLEGRLIGGLKLLRIREPDLPDKERDLFTGQALPMAHRYNCKGMVKPRFPAADGIHFTAAELLRLKKKPEGILAAASCLKREAQERGTQLRLDFPVLRPVQL